ncbi:hypothetical protein RUM43_010741 [Polyplax serrata]|uniref:Chitin-binding type-2 domain-containing protein n=1 Tax=Polyplax serrata TaxID=468196 RepID=A0AAN8PLA7_POLSC
MYKCVAVFFALVAVHFVDAQQIQCPELGVFTFPDTELCDQFYLCVNGTLTYERCENGLLFDGKGAVHNHCNYNWAVDCGNRKADHTPISTPGCEYQFGIYPTGSGCDTNYLKCEFGVPVSEPCLPGLVYDERIHTCNWPDMYLEKCNPEEIVGFKCPTRVPEDSVAARYWPFPRFPVPGDCGRLITCVNGYPRLITCGDGNVYDETTGLCQSPEHVPQCNGFKK